MESTTLNHLQELIRSETQKIQQLKRWHWWHERPPLRQFKGKLILAVAANCALIAVSGWLLMPAATPTAVITVPVPMPITIERRVPVIVPVPMLVPNLMPVATPAATITPPPKAAPAAATTANWREKASQLQLKAGEGNPKHYQRYLDSIEKVAREENFPPEILCAVIHRETHWKNGVFDNGHGHGLMQIDDRSHQTWLGQNNWQNPEANIRYGLSEIKTNLRSLGNLRHALAAYNAGTYRVKKAVKEGRSPDSPTSLKNYSAEVLRIARNLGWNPDPSQL